MNEEVPVPTSTDPTTPVVVLSTTAKRTGPPKKTARNEAFAAAYNAGASVEELSRMFNLRPNTVVQYIVKFRRWGLITRHDVVRRTSQQTAERNVEIARRRDAGATVAELAAEFTLSAMQVRNVLNEVEERRRTQIESDPIVMLAVRRSTAEEIAAAGSAGLLAHQRDLVAAAKAAAQRPPAAR